MLISLNFLEAFANLVQFWGFLVWGLRLATSWAVAVAATAAPSASIGFHRLARLVSRFGTTEFVDLLGPSLSRLLEPIECAVLVAEPTGRKQPATRANLVGAKIALDQLLDFSGSDCAH